jgi:hypothetical protein
MELSKLNRIKAAYGEHYEYFATRGIDENGYTAIDEREVYRIFDGAAKPGQESKFWRPMALVGIEHNNNWNKIGNEYPNPPAHADEFWIISAGITQTYRGRLRDFPGSITHWQYNKKPTPPIH